MQIHCLITLLSYLKQVKFLFRVECYFLQLTRSHIEYIMYTVGGHLRNCHIYTLDPPLERINVNETEL